MIRTHDMLEHQPVMMGNVRGCIHICILAHIKITDNNDDHSSNNNNIDTSNIVSNDNILMSIILQIVILRIFIMTMQYTDICFHVSHVSRRQVWTCLRTA